MITRTVCLVEQKQSRSPSPRTEKALTQKLLVKEEGAGAGPVLIHKLQELSEDSGHMGGSGRNLGTVVSWQTVQTAQVTRERLKKKTKDPTIRHSYTIREIRIQTFKVLTFLKKEKIRDLNRILSMSKVNMIIYSRTISKLIVSSYMIFCGDF